MAMREIVISRSVRVNTGNYEAVEHFISEKIIVDEDLDDVDRERRNLVVEVETMMVRQLLSSYKIRRIAKMDTAAKVAKHHGLGAYDVKAFK